MIQFRFIFAASLLLASLMTSAECVRMTAPGVDRTDEDPALPTVTLTWHAAFENACDTSVDVTLSVDLVNSDDEPLYSLSAIESFDIREKRELEKDVHVPARVAEEVTDIRIAKVERPRQ